MVQQLSALTALPKGPALKPSCSQHLTPAPKGLAPHMNILTTTPPTHAHTLSLIHTRTYIATHTDSLLLLINVMGDVSVKLMQHPPDSLETNLQYWLP